MKTTNVPVVGKIKKPTQEQLNKLCYIYSLMGYKNTRINNYKVITAMHPEHGYMILPNYLDWGSFGFIRQWAIKNFPDWKAFCINQGVKDMNYLSNDLQPEIFIEQFYDFIYRGKYLERTRRTPEAALHDAVHLLETVVVEYGARKGEKDKLLPTDKQNGIIRDIMRFLDRKDI